MEEGPWTSIGNSVILNPYDGFSKPSSISLDKIAIWIQIHDLPNRFAAMVKSLAAKVGQFVIMGPYSHDFSGTS